MFDLEIAAILVPSYLIWALVLLLSERNSLCLRVRVGLGLH